MPNLFKISLIVLCISFFTFLRNYWFPSSLVWDENGYIPESYKYLNGVMFMTDHPPLGKLFIALGEYIFHPNDGLDIKDFLTSNQIKKVPLGFSFVGVRFFPVIFGMLSSVIFFLILYKLSSNLFLSGIFSSFYLFENSLILQSRVTLTESMEFFFLLSALLYFLVLLDLKKISLRNYLVLGFILGFAISIKLNGAVFLALFVSLIYFEKKFLQKRILLREFLFKAVVFLGAVALVFCSTFYIHGILGKKVVDGNFYEASDAYKSVIAKGETANPLNLPLIIRDNLTYMKNYEASVPQYDPFKLDENGSLPFTWPIGDKAIRYLWESSYGMSRYLYFQGNPLIWLSGLAGVVLTFAFLVSKLFFKLKVDNSRFSFVLSTIFLIYILYMGSLAVLPRVLYLYHYLIPLILSLFLAFLLYNHIFEVALKSHDKRLYIGTILFAGAIFGVYLFFSPLTYYQPLTLDQFLTRSWFPFWHLNPVW